MEADACQSEGPGHRCGFCLRTCASFNNRLGAGSKAEARNPFFFFKDALLPSSPSGTPEQAAGRHSVNVCGIEWK